MKIIVLILIFFSNFIFSITFEELDFFRSITDKNSPSIIENGNNYCNDYFESLSVSPNYKYKNNFMCKFSKKRNRFYVFMLGVEKKQASSLRDMCAKILESWPEIYDHMDEKFKSHKKAYLSGFYVDNFFNKKVLDFSNNIIEDQRKIDNEINNFIIENRFNFSQDNVENNLLLQKEINKINKIYKKIINRSITDLDVLIKKILDNIVRYKIFVNDIKNFKSYSCNWHPGKGSDPYIKREKFIEFENI
tara:strand:- start:105 stop:848 length:744 start_codon:yes stop_codon:yes gene_type:complete